MCPTRPPGNGLICEFLSPTDVSPGPRNIHVAELLRAAFSCENAALLSFRSRRNYPRNAICSVTIWVRSGFLSPYSLSLNLSTLLDQFMEQNFGPHMEQNAASL